MKDHLSLFITFFKIGAFTFGGGYAMLSLIEREIVQRKGWLTQEEFIDTLSIVQVLPGPIALNLALFIGSRRRGIWGSVFAALGMIFPSFFIILSVASIFIEYRDLASVENVLKGVRPAVVALISVTVFNMILKMRMTKFSILILIVTIISITILGVSPIYLITTIIIFVGIYYIWFNRIINKRE